MAQTNMIKYILKRILIIIPTIFAVIIMTFILTRLLAGDPIDIMLPPSGTTSVEFRNARRAELGLDQPWPIQLGIYLGNFMTGDWGISYMEASYGFKVLDWIAIMIPRTLTLTVIPVVLVPFIGIKLGMTSATNRNKTADTVSRGLAVAGSAFPIFFLAMVFKLFSGVFLQEFTNGEFWFPTTGYSDGTLFAEYGPDGRDAPIITGFRILDLIMGNHQVLLIDAIAHLILPVFAMTITSLSGYTRITRASMLDVLQNDYIRTARAKGCPEDVVINKHALRNALIPVSAGIVMGFALAITNSMIIEITFNMLGMGRTYFDAIVYMDYWMINGCATIIGIAVLVGILVSDIVYTIIDPRITY